MSSIAPDATDGDDDILSAITDGQIVVGTAPLTVEEACELHRLLRGRRSVLADDRRELEFRREQEGWKRRIDASRRLAPLDDGGTVDSLAPNGQRWAA